MGPLAAELALAVAMGWAGTALAARGGDDEAAAFALGHQVAGLLFVLLRVVGAGISVVVAQQMGAGQTDRAEGTAKAGVAASVIMGLVLALAAALGAAQWMQILQAPEGVAPAAAAFLVTLAPALVFDAAVAAQTSVLRAHLQVRATLAINLLMQLTHLLLAVWWMPAMGLAGFAWAMLVGRILGVLLASWWGRQVLESAAARNSAMDGGWAEVLRAPGRWLSPILHVGVPTAAEHILYRVCATVSVAVAGALGAQTLAAQAYALQFNFLTMLPGIALGLSMEVLVGHAVGERKLKRAHRMVVQALAMGLLCSVVLATAVALAGPSLIGWFTAEPHTAALTATALWWTVALEPGRTFNLVVINGLRAAGDTRFPVMAGAASMVVVLAGGSWLLGEHLGLGLTGIWIAYAADEWVRGLIMWARWKGLHWLPHAREVLRRQRPRPLQPHAAPPSCR